MIQLLGRENYIIWRVNLYDPPIPKKVMFITEKICYDELVDKVYNIMDLDWNSHKIGLISLVPHIYKYG